MGPFEMLSHLPDARIRWVSPAGGRVGNDNQMLHLDTLALSEVPAPDVIVVAGGLSTRRYLGNAQLLAWLRAASETAIWTTSVCTGALLLGAAGLLEGRRATTHWCELAALADYGSTPVSERVVEDGAVMTAAGVSAGIDMALTLAGRLAGDHTAQLLTLATGYAPQPPYDTGTTAPDHLVVLVREAMYDRYRADGAQTS